MFPPTVAIYFRPQVWDGKPVRAKGSSNFCATPLTFHCENFVKRRVRQRGQGREKGQKYQGTKGGEGAKNKKGRRRTERKRGRKEKKEGLMETSKKE